MAKGYLELKKQIKSKIDSGLFPVGNPIPSRATIMEEFQCARATVDRAINALIADGSLKGKKGSGTYVLPPINPKRTKRFAYIVLHRQTELCETDLQPFLNCLRENFRRKNNLRFVTVDDLLQQPEPYLETGHSFIFCQLNPKYLSIMDELRKRNCNILLINRQDPDFDYITNDCLGSLLKAFEPFTGKTIGAIVEPPCLEKPYRMEYISACYQAIAYKQMISCDQWYIQCSAENSGPGTKAMLDLFTKPEKPEVLFLFALVLPYVISAMHVANLVPGKDIKIVHFDRMAETINTPGATTLQQNFLKMGFETLKWLDLVNSPDYHHKKFQKFIPAIQLTPTRNSNYNF